MTVTLEDIEKELDPEQQDTYINKRIARSKLAMMDNVIKRLKKQEELTDPATIKSLLTGSRKLTCEEFEAAVKKFGLTGIKGIEAMEKLTKAQKQYIFKRMGYDINEVK